MKVKMLEHVQGRDISGLHLFDRFQVAILEQGEPYEVTQQLGEWLLEHHKAETFDKNEQVAETPLEVVSAPFAQIGEPQEIESILTVTDGDPIMSTASQDVTPKRRRK